MIDFDSSYMRYSNNNYDLPLEENLEMKYYPENQEYNFNCASSPFEELNLHEHFQSLTQCNSELYSLFEKKEKDPESQLAPKSEPLKNFEEKNEKENKETDSIFFDINDINILSGTKRENNKNNFLGRKKKGDPKEGAHSKFKEDNIMRKIKSNFIKFITKNINSSLSPGHKKLLKIDPFVNENLGADYNIQLMEKPIKAIFEENPINGRYSKSGKGKNYNAELIKEIYEKNKVKEAIKILITSYIKYLDFMRKNNLQEFRDKIYNKEVRCGDSEENAKKYVDALVQLLFDYEDWFKSKTPRGPKQKKE